MKVKPELLKSVAKVFVKYGGNIVGRGVAGNIVIDIWESWEKSKPTALGGHGLQSILSNYAHLTYRAIGPLAGHLKAA